MNGYIASKSWYRFVDQNKRRVKPIHAAVIHWCYALANELGWPNEFQLPTIEACEMIGITDRETFCKALKDLSDFGAIRVVQESTGRFVARYVTINLPDFYLPENSEGTPGGDPIGTTVGSGVGITEGTSDGNPSGIQVGNSGGTTGGSTTKIKLNKPKETIKLLNIAFEVFWDLYGKKEDRAKSEKKWISLSDRDRELIIEDIPKYLKPISDRKYQKNPMTYLNGKCWLDEREPEKPVISSDQPRKVWSLNDKYGT